VRVKDPHHDTLHRLTRFQASVEVRLRDSPSGVLKDNPLRHRVEQDTKDLAAFFERPIRLTEHSHLSGCPLLDMRAGQILWIGVKKKAAWTGLVLLLAALAYEFGPDGSSEAGIPEGTSTTVRKAIARLRSRRPSRRCDAAFALGRLGAGTAAPFLIPLLNDAADAMGPVERIFQGLMMGAQSRPVRSCAETALSQLGAAATAGLTEAFRHPDAGIRQRATHLLALSTDPKATQFLSAYLEDRDPFLRGEALLAVAQNRHPSRIEAIRRALGDVDAQVRRLALLHAGSEQGPWVYDALFRAASDPDAAVRSLAVDRLGSLGDQRAIDVLIDRLSDDDLSVRQSAHHSLRMLTHADRGSNPADWKAWRKNAR
jgi:HEAT repeat protein